MACSNFTLLPFSGECSGHGKCINNICICDAPWESRHDFLHLSASGLSDCITHITGRYWVILPTYVLCGLCTLYALWRLYSFIPLSICKTDSKGKRRTTIPHLWTLFSAISAFAMFCALTVTVFGFQYIYIRESLFLVISGGIIASCLFFINVSLQGTLLVQLTLRSVKTKDTSRLLLQMQLILSLVAIVNSIVWIVCHLGIHFSTSVEMSLMFSRAFPFTLAICATLWIIVNTKWSNDIITSLDTHLKSMGSMLSGEAAKSSADLAKLEGALIRLRQLRGGSALSFGIMGIFGIIAGVMPVLMQFWVATIFVAILGSMSTIFALRPPGWKF